MLICPNEVDEAEDPGYEELDESMTVPEEAPQRNGSSGDTVSQRT